MQEVQAEGSGTTFEKRKAPFPRTFGQGSDAWLFPGQTFARTRLCEGLVKALAVFIRGSQGLRSVLGK